MNLEELDVSTFDFVDFGSSKGGSLEYCERQFGLKGFGVDIDQEKVRLGRALGREVVAGDIRLIPATRRFAFISMMDFLEHLPNEQEALSMIQFAATLSDCVLIAHPSFDDEDYLRELGLKQYWQDWSGHTAHLSSSQK